MIIIFDIDGTLVESGKIITENMGKLLTILKLTLKCELCVVSGGTYDKLKYQLSEYYYLFNYVFPECGSSCYYQDILIYQKNFINLANQTILNSMIKEFLSHIIKYDIMYGGHLIDRRFGLYYLSIDVDDEFDIVMGGNTGIAIFLKGWDKSQILDTIGGEDEIYFFGDKTEPGENDYPLFSNPKIKGHSVSDYMDTMNKLKKIFLDDTIILNE
jgi:phosphomannomutase